jgi:hypothetical protein
MDDWKARKLDKVDETGFYLYRYVQYGTNESENNQQCNNQRQQAENHDKCAKSEDGGTPSP